MKTTSQLAILLIIGMPITEAQAKGNEPDSFCKELEIFLSSVQPDETHELIMRTFWGAKIVGDDMIIGSKSCDHNDYEPGKALCTYLMRNSSTEFAGYNAKRILNCLSPEPGIGENLEIHSGSFSTTFGSPDRGALVDLEIAPGSEPGEMVLHLKVDGY